MLSVSLFKIMPHSLSGETIIDSITHHSKRGDVSLIEAQIAEKNLTGVLLSPYSLQD